MRSRWKVSLLISSIIIIGIMISSIFVYISYSRVIKDSTRNISELTTMNIYSEINNELTKPSYVSLTMASDTFLQEWLENETTNNQEDLINYLKGIKDKYNYNSVFLVSTETSNYYFYEGINKVVSPDDSHDVWYYDFLASEQLLELDVDQDEITKELTIFVNVKMYDSLGNISAVVGVGLEMSYVQQIMSVFETEYDLNAYLIDPTGLVQSTTNTEDIETLNIFDKIPSKLESNIISEQDSLLTSTNRSQYIISRYIEEIDWYLIVTKDSNVLTRFLLDYFFISLSVIIVVIVVTSSITLNTIKEYQARQMKLANTDYLTLLLNRRGLYKEFDDIKHTKKEAVVFITDIDQFKKVNDQFGHSEGDEVIKLIAGIINTELAPYGPLARWGGDEFTGMLIGEFDKMVELINTTLQKIQTNETLQKYDVTISVGVTYTNFDTSLDVILTKADEGLYKAKENGKNRVEIIK